MSTMAPQGLSNIVANIGFASLINEEIALYRNVIAKLHNRHAHLDVKQAEIDSERALVNNELMHYELALKIKLGTAWDSTPETSPDKTPNSGTTPDQAHPDADISSGNQNSLLLTDDGAGASPHPDAAGVTQALILTDVPGTSQAAGAQVRYEIAAHRPTVDLKNRIGKLTSYPLLTRTDSDFTDYANKVRFVDFLSTNPNRFVTCGYDGTIDIWELMSDTVATLVDSCYGTLHGSAPEYFGINPMDDSLLLAYGHKATLTVIALSGGEQGLVKELPNESVEHETGVTQVSFLKCQSNMHPVFVSSGKKNHKIVPWTMADNNWKPAASYKFHTSVVTGLCGLYHRAVFASCSRDKRAAVYDLHQSLMFQHLKMDTECSGIAANPLDYNLLCVQTSTDEQQLKLWDIRTKNFLEQHVFGWRKSLANKQTALTKPAWSPSGLLLSSGSAENTVCVFDIRFCRAKNPAITIEEHSEKIYKVAWAPTRSVLLTTSIDKKIGLHSLSGSVL